MEQPAPRPPPMRRRPQRGAQYGWLGFALTIGIVFVLALGVAGVSSLGLLSFPTAMAMTGAAIALLVAISFLTLWSLRRTVRRLSDQDAMLREQTSRQAFLATRVATSDELAQAPMVPPSTTNEGPGGYRAGVDPFETGLVYQVADVEGIAKQYGKRLDKIGIRRTDELWAADPTYVAGAVAVQPTTVRTWQSMCELMAVRGIGSQYSELLVRAGVGSISDLAGRDPMTLFSQIQKLEGRVGNRIQKGTIGSRIVQSWIDAARAHYTEQRERDLDPARTFTSSMQMGQ